MGCQAAGAALIKEGRRPRRLRLSLPFESMSALTFTVTDPVTGVVLKSRRTRRPYGAVIVDGVNGPRVEAWAGRPDLLAAYHRRAVNGTWHAAPQGSARTALASEAVRHDDAPRARLPRTLAGLASHPWVESIDDGRGTGDNLHVYLMPGFVWAGTASAVIEPTVKECCQAFREVAWNPDGWGAAIGASAAEVAALIDEAVPAEAAPAPAEAAPAEAARPVSNRLNPLAEMVLMRLQATDQDWMLIEACPIVDTLTAIGWLQRSDVEGLIGPDRTPVVECRITAAGLAAIDRHTLCFGDAAPALLPTLPGEATPPPAPSHGEAAPRLPELYPATPGTPTRAEAVQDVERRDGGGVAVICSGSPRESFRLPDTVSHCGAAAALEAAGWILSPELEALAQRWRDISGDQDPSPEAVAIAEAAAPHGRRFEVFHRTWWRAEGVPGVGESHHIGWAQTEARARYLCRRWNASHDAGPFRDRAEFTAV